MTEEQLEKLPKYAQEEIHELRRQHKALNDQLQQLLGEQKTRIVVGPVRHFLSEKKTSYIDPLDTVRFILDDRLDHERPRSYIDVRVHSVDLNGPIVLHVGASGQRLLAKANCGTFEMMTEPL